MPNITISDNAARRLLDISAKKGFAPILRIEVSGGGCQGFSYNFSLDNNIRKDDIIFENGKAKLVTDNTSLTMLSGATIDFVEGLIGSYFKVENPNASSTCGCGTSFGI